MPSPLFKFCILLVIVWSGDGIQLGGHLFLPRRQESEGTSVSSTCTSYSAPISAPIYVEGNRSREIVFRRPPLQNMQPSITTEQSLGGRDVSVFSSPDQLPSSWVARTNYFGLYRELSYGRPSFG